MKKVWILIGLVIMMIFIIIFLSYNQEKTEVCFEENCFLVELAKTDVEKERGLMFKKSLENNRGMLFIFNEEGRYNFWMKNTLITLDIIWINSEKEVVYIEHSAEPCSETCESIIPRVNAQFVLEINGGVAKKLNINIGDRARFEI